MTPQELSFPSPDREPFTVLVQCFSGVTEAARPDLRAPNAAYVNADSIVSLTHLLFGLNKALVLSKLNRLASSEALISARGPSAFERELCNCLGSTSHADRCHQEIGFDWSSSSSSSSSKKLVLVVVNASPSDLTSVHYETFSEISAPLVSHSATPYVGGSADDFLRDVDKNKKDRLVALFKIHAMELGDGKGGAYEWRDLESAVITRMATKDVVKL